MLPVEPDQAGLVHAGVKRLAFETGAKGLGAVAVLGENGSPSSLFGWNARGLSNGTADLGKQAVEVGKYVFFERPPEVPPEILGLGKLALLLIPHRLHDAQHQGLKLS